MSSVSSVSNRPHSFVPSSLITGTSILRLQLKKYHLVGVTIILAIPLIIAAFKVKNLEYFGRKFKKWRNKNFPIHFRSRGKEGKDEDDPDFEEEENPKAVWKIRRLYWGGPEPAGDKRRMADDID